MAAEVKLEKVGEDAGLLLAEKDRVEMFTNQPNSV